MTINLLFISVIAILFSCCICNKRIMSLPLIPRQNNNHSQAFRVFSHLCLFSLSFAFSFSHGSSLHNIPTFIPTHLLSIIKGHFHLAVYSNPIIYLAGSRTSSHSKASSKYPPLVHRYEYKSTQAPPGPTNLSTRKILL